MLYAFIRAMLDSILGWLGTNAGKGTKATEADEKPQTQQRAGARITEYMRLRGRLPKGSAGDRSESDTDRT